MYVLCFDDFGKNFPKSVKLSPDGFIQAAIQLTYYKLVQYTVLTHFVQLYILLCSLCVCVSLCPSSSLFLRLYGTTTAVYESGSIRYFKYGRTDTIRSCTNACHAFLKTMTDPSSSVSRRGGGEGGEGKGERGRERERERERERRQTDRGDHLLIYVFITVTTEV